MAEKDQIQPGDEIKFRGVIFPVSSPTCDSPERILDLSSIDILSRHDKSFESFINLRRIVREQRSQAEEFINGTS